MGFDITFWDLELDSALHARWMLFLPTTQDCLPDARVVVQSHVHLDFRFLACGVVLKVQVSTTTSGVVTYPSLKNSFDLLRSW